MRAFVFTDKALERYAGRFVWLSVDTENSKNADFLKKYPINVWPTMLVVDPSKERVVLRYAGGATVGQLSKLLDQAQSKTKSPADDALAHADRLANEGKNPEAAKEYERAIDAAPKGWKPLGRAAEGLMMALTMSQQNEPCAARANEFYTRLGGPPSGTNPAAYGLPLAPPPHGLPDDEEVRRGARRVRPRAEAGVRAGEDRHPARPRRDAAGEGRQGRGEADDARRDRVREVTAVRAGQRADDGRAGEAVGGDVNV